jgi:hypothetical protein
MARKANMKQAYIISALVLSCALGAVNGYAAGTDAYSWTDKDGVVHFGDLPPEGQQADTIKLQDTSQPTGIGSGDSQPVPDAEPSAAEQKREELAQRRELYKQEEKGKEEACWLAKKHLAQYEPYRRVMYTNEAGEVVRMTDDERVALVQQARDHLEQNDCD